MLLPKTPNYGALQARQDPPPDDSSDAQKANVIIAVGSDMRRIVGLQADPKYR